MLSILLIAVETIAILAAIYFKIHLWARHRKEEPIKFNSAVQEFAGTPAIYLEKAQKMLDMGENKLALSALRNSLEALIKILCSENGLTYDTRQFSMVDMISVLYDGRFISWKEKELMHQIRKACNRGDHVELDETEADRQIPVEAIANMKKLMKSIVSNSKQGQLFNKEEKKYREKQHYANAAIFCVCFFLLLTVGMFIYSKSQEWKSGQDVSVLLSQDNYMEQLGEIEVGALEAIKRDPAGSDEYYTRSIDSIYYVSRPTVVQETIFNNKVLIFYRYDYTAHDLIMGGWSLGHMSEGPTYRGVVVTEKSVLNNAEKKIERSLSYEEVRDLSYGQENGDKYNEYIKSLEDEFTEGSIELVKIEL